MTRMWENRANGASGVVRDTEPAGQGRGVIGAAGPPAGRVSDRSAHGVDTGPAAGLGDRNGHSRCVLCGGLHPRSWRLPFTPAAEDRIRAEFVASEDLQGYDGLLHGGVIAALMDTAIIHWLFQHGIRAVTGDLRVRYLQPVACNIPLELIAWLVFPCPPLYHLKAELRAGGQPLARAEGKCMRREAP